MLFTTMYKFILFLFLMTQICFGINVSRSTSTMRVKKGATFVSKRGIIGFRGKLVKEDGASIIGEDIVLQDGIFEDSETKLKLTGKLNPEITSKIMLTGNDSFKGKRGKLAQTIEVQGTNNLVEGILQLKSPLVLRDSITSLTCALQGRMSQDIELNGGLITLVEDLHFLDDYFFTGSGNIVLNRRNLHLGSTEMTTTSNLYFDNAQDIELHNTLHLEGTWTFSNQSMIDGNGNILCLENGGNIVVECGSSLLLKNMKVVHVSGTNIRCLDHLATLSLQDVSYLLDGNYSFSTGSLNILGIFDLSGSYTFVYESSQTSTIHKNSKFKLDRGVTFSFDPKWDESFTETWIDEVGVYNPWDMARELIVFVDRTSIFQIKDATLYATTTSIKLKNGTLRIKGNSYFDSDLNENFDMEEGIIIGGNSSESDMLCDFSNGSALHVRSGAFSYKNVDPKSFLESSETSVMTIYPGAILKLHQSLDSGLVSIIFKDMSRLARAYNKTLSGTIEVLGFVSNENCYNEASAAIY